MPRQPRYIGEITQYRRDNAPIWELPSPTETGRAAIMAFSKLHDIPTKKSAERRLWPDASGRHSLPSALILEEMLQLQMFATPPASASVEAETAQAVASARRFGIAVMQWHAA